MENYIAEAKHNHLLEVLHAVRSSRGATQPAICRSTGLAASAVHGLVKQLCAAGLLEEAGRAESAGGRKALCYRLCGSAGYVASVSVRLSKMVIGIYNFSLQQLCRQEHPISLLATGAEDLVCQIAQGLQQACRAAHVERAQLCGVGVTMPGPCDAATGTVHQICGSTAYNAYPLAMRLSGLLGGMPVQVEKDVFAAMGLLATELPNTQSAALLSIDGGISCALMLDGVLLKGDHGVAGEVGHIPVRSDGHKCRCGNNGCLELYCSDTGILELYNAQSGSGQNLSIEQLIEKAEKGDTLAQHLFSQGVHHLIDAIYAVLLTYDPTVLVVQCHWLNCNRALFMKMLQAVYAKSLFSQGHKVDIQLCYKPDYFLTAGANQMLLAALVQKTTALA